MKKITKKACIYWINIILLMLNTTILVFFFLNPKKIYESENTAISNDFLRKELNFTDEQYELINELDKDVLAKHQIVLKLLCQKRYQILNELAKPEPSITELNKMSTSVGYLHRALKTQTIRHLLNIKKVCTQEQSQKLEKVFIDLLEINKHCAGCPEKCTKREKHKKCPQIRYFKEEMEMDSLKSVLK